MAVRAVRISRERSDRGGLAGSAKQGGEGHQYTCGLGPTWLSQGLGLLRGGPRDPDMF